MITLTREEAQYIFETLDNLPVKIWGETAAQILRTRLALHDMNKAAEQNGEEL